MKYIFQFIQWIFIFIGLFQIDLFSTKDLINLFQNNLLKYIKLQYLLEYYPIVMIKTM